VYRLIKTPAKLGFARFVAYTVSWVNALGENRVTSFQAGREDTLTPEQEAHAHQTALAFREDWEFCQDTGTPFDPLPYKAWRRVTCYPFTATAPL
jgi:hypothetical protein